MTKRDPQTGAAQYTDGRDSLEEARAVAVPAKRDRQHSVVCGTHSVRYPAAYGQCPHCASEATAESGGARPLVEPVTIAQSTIYHSGVDS